MSIAKNTIAKMYTYGWYYCDRNLGIKLIHNIQYPIAIRFMLYFTHIGTLNSVKHPQIYPIIIVQKYAGTPSTTATTGYPAFKLK